MNASAGGIVMMYGWKNQVDTSKFVRTQNVKLVSVEALSLKSVDFAAFSRKTVRNLVKSCFCCVFAWIYSISAFANDMTVMCG